MSKDFKDAIKVAMTGLVLFPVGIGMHFGSWAGVAACGAEGIVFGLIAAVLLQMEELGR